MRSNYFSFFKIVLAVFALNLQLAHSQNNTNESLFDFSKSIFPNGADPTRQQWEKDFVEFGKTTEKTPQNYLKHLFKIMEMNGESHELYDYRFAYLFGTGRYEFDNFKSASENLWADKTSVREGYLLNSISRSNENIKRLWNVFDDLILEIINPYMEENRLERMYTRLLVEAWECMSSKKNYQKKLDKIYVKLVEEGAYNWHEYGALMECESVNRQLNTPRDQNLEWQKSWIYSFWVRRHHEGNAEITYTIFKAFLN